MRAFLPLLSLSAVAQALYFYIDGTTPKCFFEELPKDTLVVGQYSAAEWDDRLKDWAKHDGISIYITVDVRTPMSSRTFPEEEKWWTNGASLCSLSTAFLFLHPEPWS